MGRILNWSLALCSLAAADGGAPSGANLKGHWTFDDPLEPRWVNATQDLTGRNDGSFFGGVLRMPGKYENGLFFNGSNGYVAATTHGLPSLSSPVALSWWQYVSEETAGAHCILALQNVPANASLQIGLVGRQLMAWNWGGNLLVSGPAPLPDAWRHVAYTYDGAEHRLYVDGQLSGLGHQAPNSSAFPSELSLGRYEYGEYYGSGLQGGAGLDDVRIYDAAITAEEVARLASPPPGPPNLHENPNGNDEVNDRCFSSVAAPGAGAALLALAALLVSYSIGKARVSATSRRRLK